LIIALVETDQRIFARASLAGGEEESKELEDL